MLSRGLRRAYVTIGNNRFDPLNEPFYPIPNRQPKWATAEEAIGATVKNGNTVFIQGGSATPTPLINELCQQADRLKGVKVYHIHLEGDVPFFSKDISSSIRSTSLFIGHNARKAVAAGYADFLPIFLSEVPTLFRNKVVPLDVSMVHVCPPDKNGFVSLGTSIDVTRAAVQMSNKVIGLVNPHVPRTHGDSFIHISHFDYLVQHDAPIHRAKPKVVGAIEKKIGENVANIIEDGATLQMGIGSIPDAVLSYLTNHKLLGVHSEMFSDGILKLIKNGNISNSEKTVFPGKIVGGFTVGSQELYDFIDDNPFVLMMDIGFVNNPAIISQNPKVTAINMAVEVDLTGQVVADSVGTRMLSGPGGQLDFMRGAAIAHRGKPIIAIPSTNADGTSKIVAVGKLGGGVVTTRQHAHYIATEYGVAHIYGLTFRERARALIEIAHPDHREALERSSFERLKTSVTSEELKQIQLMRRAHQNE